MHDRFMWQQYIDPLSSKNLAVGAWLGAVDMHSDEPDPYDQHCTILVRDEGSKKPEVFTVFSKEARGARTWLSQSAAPTGTVPYFWTCVFG
jgi:hypothetical protein